MEINGVFIDDTWAEAFAMTFARLLVTAEDQHWLREAVAAATGMATSIIGCDVEAGLESVAEHTPDGRPGANLLFFARNADKLKKSLVRRIGQGVMTCPTTTVYSANHSGIPMDIGARIRYFGDGFEFRESVNERDFWVIPVTEGRFAVEETFYFGEGVAGGAFMIAAENRKSALNAARKAVDAIAKLPGVILPFPGGVVRCASKTGSRYKFLHASTNEVFCPTLRDKTATRLPEGVKSVLEIVIDGIDLPSVETAMKKGILAACEIDGVMMISSANFGGRLGKMKIPLRKIFK